MHALSRRVARRKPHRSRLTSPRQLCDGRGRTMFVLVLEDRTRQRGRVRGAVQCRAASSGGLSPTDVKDPVLQLRATMALRHAGMNPAN